MIPLVIGAAVAGGLLAALLFRMWMALSGAVLLALAIPAAVLIWQGTPTPATPATSASAPAATQPASQPALPSLNLSDDLPHQLSDTTAQPGDQGPTTREAVQEATRKKIDEALGKARDVAATWYAQIKERLVAWWDHLDPHARRLLYGIAAVGAIVGLVARPGGALHRRGGAVGIGRCVGDVARGAGTGGTLCRGLGRLVPAEPAGNADLPGSDNADRRTHSVDAFPQANR